MSMSNSSAAIISVLNTFKAEGIGDQTTAKREKAHRGIGLLPSVPATSRAHVRR